MLNRKLVKKSAQFYECFLFWLILTLKVDMGFSLFYGNEEGL